MNTVCHIPSSLEELTADPRIGAAQPAATHLPACDGGPWPDKGASEAVPRQQLEFLAIYTHLNRLHDQLREIRAGGGTDEKTGPVLAALRQVIHFRDRLEDYYAPIGFYAEPVMDGQLAVNLIFHHAQKYVCENHRRNEPITAVMKVELPEKNLREEFASVEGIPIETILADLRWPKGGLNHVPNSETS